MCFRSVHSTGVTEAFFGSVHSNKLTPKGRKRGADLGKEKELKDSWLERGHPSVVMQRARRRMKRKELSAITWSRVESGEGHVAPRKKKKKRELERRDMKKHVAARSGVHEGRADFEEKTEARGEKGRQDV